MLKITNLRLECGFSDGDLESRVCEVLKISKDELISAELLRLSVDARHKDDVHFTATAIVRVHGEGRFIFIKNVEKYLPEEYEYPCVSHLKKRPLVVGGGPAGLFAALILATAGASPILIERGHNIKERKRSVDAFFNGGELDLNTNVQFGLGGAGAFSDGKLNTGTRDIRHKKILDEFVAAGAPKEIRYLAKPHVGTDNLMRVVENLQNKIIALGGEVWCDSMLEDIVIEENRVTAAVENGKTIDTDAVILAVGHSARDTFEMLDRRGVPMEKKTFSVGFRIEQSQRMINTAQYGKFAPRLGAADYKLSVPTKSGRTVYTFCMCPGGVVVPAASEKDTVVTNGMSYFARDGENANSAVLVNVFPDDLPDGALSGMYFQRELERSAFDLGGGSYVAPAQLAKDYINGEPSAKLGDVAPSYVRGVRLCDVSPIFPKHLNSALREGLTQMNIRIHGFCESGAVLTAVESRSSSPVRILRGEDCQSSISGLYPCGEGAGYAGGIMSAAADGIRCAEAVLRRQKT